MSKWCVIKCGSKNGHQEDTCLIDLEERHNIPQ